MLGKLFIIVRCTFYNIIKYLPLPLVVCLYRFPIPLFLLVLLKSSTWCRYKVMCSLFILCIIRWSIRTITINYNIWFIILLQKVLVDVIVFLNIKIFILCKLLWTFPSQCETFLYAVADVDSQDISSPSSISLPSLHIWYNKRI